MSWVPCVIIGGVVFNMDNETLPDEVLHKRMNDIERLRDPSHTHFPLPYQLGWHLVTSSLA
jgi:hypothetical protein